MFRDEIVPLIVVVLIVVVCVMCIIRVGGEIGVYGDIAQIDQLREDVVRIASGSNEDVIGQVTHWNQIIMRRKRYRQKWWGWLLVPEEWEDIHIIKIPWGNDGSCSNCM